MGRITTRKPITRLDDGYTRRRQDTLAVEEPLELRIGSDPYVVTMRTPGHDVELAAGFLFTEGVITTAEHLRYARHRQSHNVLEIGLTVPTPPSKRFTTTSACGVCGKESIDHLHTVAHRIISENVSVDWDLLAALPDRLRSQQTSFDKTGGTHAAGIFDLNGHAVVTREDVGRHNAVDKVIGWALLNDVNVSETILQVSGRASFELVNKATMAGIPIFGAVSAPSSMAVDMAEKAGITLAGFMRGTRMNLYANPHRIRLRSGAWAHT